MNDVATPSHAAPLSHHDQVLHDKAQKLLDHADVRINGDRPWDIQIRDERLYARVFAHGSMGLGDAYMDGWWDAQALDQFFFHVLRARLDEQVEVLDALISHLRARYVNMQRGGKAFKVGRVHYDTGNDLFAAMLGKYKMYSCGYWADTDDLDAAQEAKLDRMCQRLGLQAGQKVLDVGCGWGQALKFAAERYGVSGVGVTVSNEQARFARELCKGLPVEIRVQDYRELNETFDAVYSIGMMEHVGGKNYRNYFEVVRRCLKPDGLFMLYCIGTNATPSKPDPWIEKYVFPNSMVPAASQVTPALENLFVVEAWENFGVDYDKTLMAWIANFNAAWPQLSAANPRYDERFRRMWLFYLASSAATFRTRRDQLWELTLSPDGVAGGFRTPR
ncbi:MAG TPA: cyclopropane fatty acyl phospholipid synthase [Rhodanobacteraceae bacterium]